MRKSIYYKSIIVAALMLITSQVPAKAQESLSPEEAVVTDGFTAKTAGTEEINQAVKMLSAELMQSLSPTGTYAIKSADDTTSGVPEDLLTQINSALQASLMVASNFQVTLIDQAQLNTAWQNSVEFNGADFEKLVSNANFSAIILLHVRATKAGLEVSLQAVSTEENNAGAVIAVTNPAQVLLDWDTAIGIDVKALKSEYEQVLQEIELLKKQPNDITFSTADTFSKRYVLAKQLAQNGDLANAIDLLIKCLEENKQFADPAILLSNLLTFQFGNKDKWSYIENKLSNIPADQLLLVKAADAEYSLSDADLMLAKSWPPSLQMVVLSKMLMGPLQDSSKKLTSPTLGFMADEIKAPILKDIKVLFIANLLSRRVDELRNSGDFKYYFIDPETPENLFKDKAAFAVALNPPEWLDFSRAHSIFDSVHDDNFTVEQLRVLIDDSAKTALEIARGDWQTATSNGYFEDGIWKNALSGTISSSLLMATYVNAPSAIEILNAALPYYMAENAAQMRFSKCIRDVGLLEFMTAYQSIGDNMTAQSISKEIQLSCIETENYRPLASVFPNISEYNVSFDWRGNSIGLTLESILDNTSDTDGKSGILEIRETPDLLMAGNIRDRAAFLKPKLLVSLAALMAKNDSGAAKMLASEAVMLSAQNRTSFDALLVENAAIAVAAKVHGFESASLVNELSTENSSIQSETPTPFSLSRTSIFATNWRQDTCTWGLLESPSIVEKSSENVNPYIVVNYKLKTGYTLVAESECKNSISPVDVVWEAEMDIVAYCSLHAPAIDFDAWDSEPVSVLSIFEPPGYMVTAASIYLKACHGEEEISAFDDIIGSLGYSENESPTFKEGDDWKRLHSSSKTVELEKEAENGLNPIDNARIVIETFGPQQTENERAMLQEILANWGIYGGAYDGDWGPATEQALEKFFYAVEESGISYNLSSSNDFVKLVTMMMSPEFTQFFEATQLEPDVSEFIGQYNGSGVCDAQYDSDESLTVTATSFKFYESSCQISSVSSLGSGKKSIDLNCEGEGEEWQTTFSVSKNEVGDLLIEVGDETSSFQACE